MEEGFCIIDIGHYETEHFFGEIIKKELEEFEGIETVSYTHLTLPTT